MSRSRLQRPFAHLALLAMLALSLLPSAGRIAAALRSDDAVDTIGLTALCSPSGLGAISPAAKLAAQLQAALQFYLSEEHFALRKKLRLSVDS